MRSRKHIIDDSGRVWMSSDLGFRASLGGSDLSDAELLGFVTRNLGFVEISSSSTASRVVLREEVVGSAARASLVYYLMDRPRIDHIRVRDISNDAVPEAVMSSQGFIAWLRKTELDRELEAQTRFRQTPLAARFPRQIDQFLALWRQKRTRAETEIRDYCSAHFAERFLFARRQGAGDLMIAAIGAGYESYTHSYLRQAEGTRLAEDPDYLYGAWVEKHYQEADRAQKPHVSRVKARIMPPYRASLDVTYDRVILPFVDLHGAPYLVSASLLVPGN